jgi:hypothetical protein
MSFKLVEIWLRNFSVDLERNPDVMALYNTLIEEELKEFNAETEVSEAGLKEAADLLWVAIGKVLVSGYTAQELETAIGKVAESNLSKLCSESEAKEYVKNNPDTYYKVNEFGRCTIHRASDHKIMKGPNYKQADLSNILISKNDAT